MISWLSADLPWPLISLFYVVYSFFYTDKCLLTPHTRTHTHSVSKISRGESAIKLTSSGTYHIVIHSHHSPQSNHSDQLIWQQAATPFLQQGDNFHIKIKCTYTCLWENYDLFNYVPPFSWQPVIKSEMTGNRKLQSAGIGICQSDWQYMLMHLQGEGYCCLFKNLKSYQTFSIFIFANHIPVLIRRCALGFHI